METGKILYILTLLSLIAPLIGVELSMVGHLAFMASKPGPVNVNPRIINFHRKFDMRLLENSLNMAEQFVHHYKHFCSLLRSDKSKNVTIMVLPNVQYTDKPKQCNNLGHEHFEVRTEADAELLSNTMLKYHVTSVHAPVRVLGNEIVYTKDNSHNEWLQYKHCTTGCQPQDKVAWDVLNKHFNQNKVAHFLYELHPNKTIVIKIGFINPGQGMVDNLACSSIVEENTELFNRVAKHSCKRDASEMIRTNEYLYNELQQIASPKDSPKAQIEQVRKRRAIALIGAGLLGVEALSNAFGGTSPLSSLGKGMAYTLGIATHSDLEITRKELEKHAHAIDDLAINQRQLQEATNTLGAEIDRLIQAQEKTQHDMAVMYVDFDNKINIFRLQAIVQDTIIKMAASIQSAQLMQTSPFVFGKRDLLNLTKQFRMQNIPLTAHLEEVLAQVILVDNKYTFIFSVPIINALNNFHLYEVKALPVFKDGEGYSITINNKYIAINSATMEYFTASESEFDYCQKYPLCTVTEPFRKVTTDSPCEVKSLKFQTNLCPVTPAKNLQPAFISNRNITYFSVPHPMEIHVICTQSGKEFNQHTTINDYGYFNIPDGCEVRIANDISFRPGFVLGQHTLIDNSLFEILEVPDRLPEFPQMPETELTPRKQLSFKTIESMSEGFSLIFEGETTAAEVIRIITYIAITLTIVGIFYCCCRPCRLWVNGCCFFQKPTVYWKKIRGYKVPEFQNLRRQKAKSEDDNKVDIDLEARTRTVKAFQALTDRVKRYTNDFALNKTPVNQPTTVDEINLDEISVLPPTPPQEFRTLHLISHPNLYHPKPFPK